MLHIFGRRQEKNTYVWASCIELGLRFLLEGFPGQKQSWGAKLNVFFVLLVLKWAPKWVFSCFSVQAEDGSRHHNQTFNITMTQSCRPPPAVMRLQSKHIDAGETQLSLSLTDPGKWNRTLLALKLRSTSDRCDCRGSRNHLCQFSDVRCGTSVGVLQGQHGATCLTSHYTYPLILPVTTDRLREPWKKEKRVGGGRVNRNGRCKKKLSCYEGFGSILKPIPAPGLGNKPISATDDWTLLNHLV